MSQETHLQKYGIYDPVTKMFYTVPASGQDDLRKFMETFCLLHSDKQKQH